MTTRNRKFWDDPLTREKGIKRLRQQAEQNTTHGMSHHPLFKTVKNMCGRCCDERHPDYADYGGRGISVCPQWNLNIVGIRAAVLQLEADMGKKPTPEHSLDRINNAGNYEPGNCRWATAIEQRANRRQPKQYKRRCES